jgi:hypothetical protein
VEIQPNNIPIKEENMKKRVLMLVAILVSSLLAACQPAAQPIPTATIAPTVAVVPTETPEPAPTATLAPTEPALAAIGELISSDNWELTVIAITLMEGNVFDVETNGYYQPYEGNRFAAVALKVKPLGSMLAVPIGSVMIYDENGQPYGAYYYGSQDAASGEVDPFTITVKRCLAMAIVGGVIDIPSESYFHIIYQVPEASLGKEITFMFDDVVPVAFTLE